MIKLSYIIVTRNRLSYLQITLLKLVNELQPGEEIVVVDGNSTDGTKEYLQHFFDSGKIQQFISEPDRNQADGWNKALLMARGTIIKKIIDDDVHDYNSIRQCMNYMLKNPQADICISNCLTTGLTSPRNIEAASRYTYFQDWKNGITNCFTFSDVSMLIRKSSLSFLGLYDVQFCMIDWEYALRCSYLKANIAYYTGYNSLTVGTPGNVTSITNSKTLKREAEIGKVKYGYKGDRNDISLFSELKIAVVKAINYTPDKRDIDSDDPVSSDLGSLADIYDYLYKYLDNYNKTGNFNFVSK